MYCKTCGKEIDDESNFCFYCGATLKQGVRSETIENVNEEQPRNHKKLFILFATFLFVAVAVTSILLFNKKTPLAEYDILDSNPTSEQINTTVSQLQERAKSLGANISVTVQGTKTLSVYGKEDALTENELKALISSGELHFILYSDLETESGGMPSEEDKVVYDKTNVLMTGDMISEAISGSRQQEGTGKTEHGVSIKFVGKGVKKFAEITGAHVGEQLAIVYDEKLVSAPALKEEITGGECWISGNFTAKSAEQLASTLCTGKLSLNLQVKKIY